jgi:cytochrome c oxidase subunit III
MDSITEQVTNNVQSDMQLWEGGQSPFKIRYGKLMMWYFLLSDAFTFAGFLISYGAIRFSIGQENWPDPNRVFDGFPILGHGYPLMFVSLMTFILILSSVFMVRGVQEGHQMNKKGVMMWLGLTIVLGLSFLGCQAWEWMHLIEGGMTLTTPWQYIDHHTQEVLFTAPLAFGQLFFTITGFHGFHVSIGVLLNVIVFINVAKGTYEKKQDYEMVEKVGLYWHFVDLVWIFVFLSFYLL